MHVDLPDGGWAEIRGIDELKGGDKVAVQRVLRFVPDAEGGIGEVSAGLSEDMQQALLCRVITSWSLELPLPPTAAVLEDLPVAVYSALCEAVEDHFRVLQARPSPRTPSA